MRVPNYLFDIPPIDGWEVVFYAFCFAALVQLIFIIFIFTRVGFHKRKNGKPTSHAVHEPVSVVICARNERANLLEFLPAVLHQDYPDFEVVVVNDASSDDTIDVLRAYEHQYPHLSVKHIKENERFYYSKKYALTIGIKAAKNDIVLLTDADCKPSSPQWIREMVASLHQGKSIVLGYGAHMKTKGLLNKIIRYDTFYTGVQYLSLCKSGLPYMGVGRNLAYRKELFFENSGFASHQHIQSGDDDLFINEVADKKNTTIEISDEARTISIPHQSFRSWFRQKRRHLTTGPHYKARDKFVLGSWITSQIMFWILGIALLVVQHRLELVAIILGTRCLLQLVTFTLATRKIGGRDLVLLAPLLEIFFIIFNPVIVLSNTLVKDKSWR